MNKKIILTDCDGVLLDWETAFDEWMINQGHSIVPDGHQIYGIGKRYNIEKSHAKKLVKIFNESANIGFLNPLRDAAHYVKRLHEEYGYVFHCITSLSTDLYACKLREQNVKRVFGEHTFEKFIFLDTGADKDDALALYKDSNLFWIEDKIENYLTGKQLGLQSVLIKHDHNVNRMSDNFISVQNWKELFSIIIENVV